MVSVETQKYQEQLQQLLIQSGYTCSELAQKMGMLEWDVYYALNRATKLDISFYISAKEILERKISSYSINPTTLIGKAFNAATSITSEMNNLLQKVETITADGKVSQSEKLELANKIADVVAVNQALLEKFKLFVEGKND